MSKAAIYCRLSEEDRNKVSPEDDSVSIQNQKSMLLQYAMQQGWEVFHSRAGKYFTFTATMTTQVLTETARSFAAS